MIFRSSQVGICYFPRGYYIPMASPLYFPWNGCFLTPWFQPRSSGAGVNTSSREFDVYGDQWEFPRASSRCWVVPPPSNSGKWRLWLGSPTKNHSNPGGDCFLGRGTAQAICFFSDSELPKLKLFATQACFTLIGFRAVFLPHLVMLSHAHD